MTTLTEVTALTIVYTVAVVGLSLWFGYTIGKVVGAARQCDADHQREEVGER